MTREQKQALTWLQYRSQVTGKTEEEIRQEMAERGRLGGSSGRGKNLTKEHKQAISRGRRAKQQQITAS